MIKAPEIAVTVFRAVLFTEEVTKEGTKDFHTVALRVLL